MYRETATPIAKWGSLQKILMIAALRRQTDFELLLAGWKAAGGLERRSNASATCALVFNVVAELMTDYSIAIDVQYLGGGPIQVDDPVRLIEDHCGLIETIDNRGLPILCSRGASCSHRYIPAVACARPSD